MPANMIACPPVEVLERLLDERLAESDRDAVESHVETCGDCQTTLETLLASSYRPPTAHERATDADSSTGFLERLAKLTPHEATEAQPVRRLGQYEIVELLGKGGMGEVYRARHLELGKFVALKVLNPDRLDEVAVARFKQEIRAVGRLDHPNIVVAHDAGKADGRLYLVMEFIDGLDLGRLVEQRGALPVADACEAVRQAAVGLQHAYERGLVHRDVKPSNLIVGKDGRVRLLDLGLARSFGDAPADKLTAQGALLGTADYLAPEQWDQPHAADIRADIYSLGCTLFHLLVGHAPFAGPEHRTVLAKMRSHVEKPAPLASRTNGAVPAKLDSILQKMLAKRAAERYATPAEVAEALVPFAAGSQLGSSVAASKCADASPLATAPTAAPLAETFAARTTRRSWRGISVGAVAVACLAGLAMISLGPWIPKPQQPTIPNAPIPPAAIADFRINHYQGKDAKLVGDVSLVSQTINVKDGVRVYARFDRPTYCYLIALNPDGSEQLCHPAFEDANPQEAQQALAVRPQPVTELKFFPDDKSDFSLDSPGLQAFVLLASSKPLPSYGEWRAQFGKAPWKPVSFGGEHRWEYDGERFARLPAERGGRVERKDRTAEPQIIRDVCEALKTRPGVEAIRALAFPVVNRDEAAELAVQATEFCKQDRFADALATLQRQVEFLKRTKGEKHYQTTDALRGVQTIEKVAAMPKPDRDKFIGLYKVYDDTLTLENEGKYLEAIPLARRHWEERQRLFGPKHDSTAVTAVKLAQLLYAVAKYDEAEPLFRGALETVRGIVAEDHPVIGTCCSNLAQCLSAQDKHAEAGPYYEQALASARRHYGENDFNTAISYNNIAAHYDRLGQYDVSERHYTKSLDILLRTDGEDSRRVIISRSNLAYNLSRQTRYADAEPLYRSVLAARRKVLGEDHPDTAMSYGNLATNLDELSRHAEAEPLARKAVELLRARFGDDNAQTAIAVNNLAMNFQHQGRFADAEPLFRKAVEAHIRTSKDGVSRRAANVLNNLGTNLQYQGKFAEAQKTLEAAVAMYKKVLPADNPDTVQSQINLAALFDAQGKHTAAEALLRPASELLAKKYGKENALAIKALANLGVNLHNQGKYAAAEPLLAEALELHRKALGENHARTTWNYLKLVVNRWALGKRREIADLGQAAAASFESVRKGMSATGLDRTIRTNELSPLLNYLSATAALAEQPVVAWQYLERRLGRGLMDDLAARAPNAVRAVAELPQIQASLDPDMALVCWLDVAGDPAFKEPEGAHYVCAVRKTGNPIWIKIGEDDKLAAELRNRLSQRPTAADRTENDLAGRLYSRRLAPLEKYFGARGGQPDVRHLIVLPSNTMAGVPIEALTDKYTVSYAPSAATFAHLRQARGPAPSASRNLLALGDPTFRRSAAAEKTDLAQRTTEYAPLSATRLELQAVTRLFPSTSLLMGSEASEQNLKRMASAGDLLRFRFLHFATHGVLDDERQLNSALILAQDDLPDPLAKALAGAEPTDGRVTAREILRDWKLDADLVTLSACETALGKFGGGEGFVGFSQALFVAGARSVLASNWKVDDRATALLMTRFYENLLGAGAKPLSKAAALAEAKQWLRALTAEEVARLTADLPQGMPTGTRGSRRTASEKPAAATPRPFAHPYYWSAFVLIGDPS